jgi:Amt family ammonium transporter
MCRHLLVLILFVTIDEVSGTDAKLLKKLTSLEEIFRSQQEVFQQQQRHLQTLEENEQRRQLMPRPSDQLTPGVVGHGSDVRLYSDQENVEGALTAMWLLLMGVIVLLVQAGLAMIEVGSCRARNAQQILVIKLAAICISSLAWWSLGWCFAYGGPFDSNGFKEKFVGTDQFFARGFLGTRSDGQAEPTVRIQEWFFTWTFCATATAIVSGGLAERAHLVGFCIHSALMSAFIYPIIVASTWGKGWFAKEYTNPGFTDFAGAGIVHVAGGFAAFAGTLLVWYRPERWDDPRPPLPGVESASLGPLDRVRGLRTQENSTKKKGDLVDADTSVVRDDAVVADASVVTDPFAPHSAPLLCLGTFLTWLGWFGFNCGSTLSMNTAEKGFQAAQAAMNTALAASAGGLVALVIRGLVTCKLETAAFCGGIRAGLVAITAAAINVDSWYAALIGVVGAALYQLISMLLKLIKVDDPVDAFAIHGMVGVWGTLATVLFDYGKFLDTFHGTLGFQCLTSATSSFPCAGDLRTTPLLQNLAFVGIIAGWSFGTSLVIFGMLRLPGLIPPCRRKLKRDLLKAELPVPVGGTYASIDTEYHYPLKAYIGEGASNWGGKGPIHNPYFHSI